MYEHELDVSDPTTLEAEMEAAPQGTPARVTTAAGETLAVTRSPGGWHLDGDLTVTSGDVAEARPRAVTLLLRPDCDGDDEGLTLLADVDPDEAAGLRAWRDARRAERGEA
jgi:hypothetical protein